MAGTTFFARDPQGLPAGRQDAHLWTGAQQPFDQGCASLNQVFAVVQGQQKLLIVQILDNPIYERQARRLGYA